MFYPECLRKSVRLWVSGVLTFQAKKCYSFWSLVFGKFLFGLCVWKKLLFVARRFGFCRNVFVGSISELQQANSYKRVIALDQALPMFGWVTTKIALNDHFRGDTRVGIPHLRSNLDNWKIIKFGTLRDLISLHYALESPSAGVRRCPIYELERRQICRASEDDLFEYRAILGSHDQRVLDGLMSEQKTSVYVTEAC